MTTEHIHFCSWGPSGDWFLVQHALIIRCMNFSLLRIFKTISLCFAKISNRDEFFSSFDFSPQTDWDRFLGEDRHLRCSDEASGWIIVLEGGIDDILKIVSLFWMPKFRRLICLHHSEQFDRAADVLHMICCGVLNRFHELWSAPSDLRTHRLIFSPNDFR